MKDFGIFHFSNTNDHPGNFILTTKSQDPWFY